MKEEEGIKSKGCWTVEETGKMGTAKHRRRVTAIKCFHEYTTVEGLSAFMFHWRKKYIRLTGSENLCWMWYSLRYLRIVLSRGSRMSS